MIEWLSSLEPPKSWGEFIALLVALVVLFTALLHGAGWLIQRAVRGNRRIELDEIRCVPMYRPGAADPDYQLVQVWFQNRERKSLAERVSAYIEVLGKDGSVLVDAYSLWAVGTSPNESGGWTQLEAKKDIAPDGIPAKLNVALRYHGKAEAELFSADAAHHLVPVGTHQVRVTLRGIEVHRRFHFRLTNANQLMLVRA